MNHLLTNFNKKNFKYDLINKFFYTKTKNLSKINKIILHFNCKNSEIDKLASSLLALKVLTYQKGKLVMSKKSNVLLKIRKGHPIGCKIILKKKKKFFFLNNFLNKLKSNVINFNTLNKLEKKNFSIEVVDPFNNFNELKTNFYFFNSLKNLEVSFVVNSLINKDTIFTLKSYKLFLKTDKWISGRVV